MILKNTHLPLHFTKQTGLAFFEKAAGAGLSPEELIENFINVLVYGELSNGSDESDLAQSWFDRCSFSHTSAETFLQYLINYGDLDTFLEHQKTIDEAEDEIESYKYDLRNNTYERVEGRTGLWAVYYTGPGGNQPV